MLKPLQKLQFWHFQKCFYLFFIEIFITLSGFPCPQEIGQSWPILKVTGKFEEKTWAKPFTFLKLSGKVMRKSIHVQQEQQHGYNLNLKLDTLAIVICVCVCVSVCMHACMRACVCSVWSNECILCLKVIKSLQLFKRTQNGLNLNINLHLHLSFMKGVFSLYVKWDSIMWRTVTRRKTL